MAAKKRNIALYMKMFPESRRWLNQCITCGSIGYKPEMPNEIYPGMKAKNLRMYFTPLAVNDLSVCEQCERHWTEHGKD